MPGFAAFRKEIVAALTPPLASRGFMWRAAQERFVRKGGAGVTHAWHVLITETVPYARLDVHLALRLDAVEEIFHRTSGYERKYQARTPTMGGALGMIANEPRIPILLHKAGGLQGAVDILLSPTMLNFYEEWYARFSQLAEIDRELNADPRRETPNRPMPWLRCATGIIVASLVGRPDYEVLADAYSEILRAFSNGFYLPRFEALLRERAEARGGTE
jgi:hypothetical protein